MNTEKQFLNSTLISFSMKQYYICLLSAIYLLPPGWTAVVQAQCTRFTKLHADNNSTTFGNGNSRAMAFEKLWNAFATAVQSDSMHSVCVVKYIFKPTDNNNRVTAFLSLRGSLKRYSSYPSSGGADVVTPTTVSSDVGTAQDSTDSSCRVVIMVRFANGKPFRLHNNPSYTHCFFYLLCIPGYDDCSKVVA